jgi:hypothetical protein
LWLFLRFSSCRACQPLRWGHRVAQSFGIWRIRDPDSHDRARNRQGYVYDGVTVLGTGEVSSGVATLSTILLPAGTRKLRTYYAGDAANSAVTSTPVVQQVNPVAVHTYISSPVANNIAENLIAVGDFNRDGKLDFVTAGAVGELALGARLGNGDGTFQTPNRYSTENVIMGVAVADINDDGYPDIITSNGAQNNNGDGNTDVVVANFSAQSVTVFWVMATAPSRARSATRQAGIRCRSQ